MINFLRSLVSDFRAWRRGERRVAPRSARGRVYARPDSEALGPVRVRREPTARLLLTITRANGSIEHVEAPASITKVA